MKIVGLITEYNPFHNGHLYHLEKAKELTGCDCAVAVMSGDFVQRGGPALLPKHLRARMALACGVSAVLELPVCCAGASAEYFASGAVSLLDSLGCVDALCFGSECGDLKLLLQAARILEEEPDDYRRLLRDGLKRGLSFPRARQEALVTCTKDPAAGQVLSSPNNILGIEYIRAARRLGSKMELFTLPRQSSGYHDVHLTENCSSASAIRALYENRPFPETLSLLGGQVPPSCLPILEEAYQVRYPVFSRDFSLLLKYRLSLETKESLTQYADVSADLANRIMNRLGAFIDADQFCGLLKTKELTYSRISRALFHILLGIRASDAGGRGAVRPGYARILGFRRDSAQVLTEMKAHSRIPLLTKLTQTAPLDPDAKKMLECDLFASSLYESVVADKFHLPCQSEYQKQVVIL